jgi:DNA-directed RNA polymerase III subunit RPC4
MDLQEKRMCVLGEIHRRFVVSPDIDTLLTAMEQEERPRERELELEGLISMDAT